MPKKIKSKLTGKTHSNYKLVTTNFMTYAYDGDVCLGGNHGFGEEMAIEDWEYVEEAEQFTEAQEYFSLTQQILAEVDRLRETGSKIREIESDKYYDERDEENVIRDSWDINLYFASPVLNVFNLRRLIIDVWEEKKPMNAQVHYGKILGYNGLWWYSETEALKYLLEELKSVK